MAIWCVVGGLCLLFFLFLLGNGERKEGVVCGFFGLAWVVRWVVELTWVPGFEGFVGLWRLWVGVE
jgi:hypothetical protein